MYKDATGSRCVQLVLYSLSYISIEKNNGKSKLNQG